MELRGAPPFPPGHAFSGKTAALSSPLPWMGEGTAPYERESELGAVGKGDTGGGCTGGGRGSHAVTPRRRFRGRSPGRGARAIVMIGRAKELRLALVCYGGNSLAVQIHG